MRKLSIQLLVLTAVVMGFAACMHKNPMAKVKDKPDGIYALITTQRGDILLFLESEKAPLTTANFVGLAEGKIKNTFRPEGKPFYDSLTFHRIEPGFVIQGGDPQGNGQGGPGYQFLDEIVPDLKHDKAGTIAMANAGPNTNGCQFYITFKPTPFLDGHYSVFGHVVEGQGVVDSTQKDDKIVSIKILRKGEKAEKFDAAKIFNEKQAAAQAELQRKLAEQQQKDEAALAQYKEKAKTTASGLMYIMEKEGKGKQAKSGDTVSVHYAGFLLDGSKFDSSFDRGQPISLVLGSHMVIPGWEEGIALFKEGGKGKLIIPPGLAYGAQGRPPVIPQNATLVFDIELVKVSISK